MPTSANTRIAHRIVDQSVNQLRVAAGVKRDVFALLKKLEGKLVQEVAKAELTEFKETRFKNMLNAVRDVTGNTYKDVATVAQTAVERVAVAAVEATATTVEATIGINLLGEAVGTSWVADVVATSLTQGATNAAWWGKQAADLVFKFEQAVRLGMVANETTDQIISRLRGDDTVAGVLFQSRANAAALVQTSIAEGANAARLEMYRRNADILAGVQQISTLDDRTTDICMAYDGATWDLNGEPLGDTDLPFAEGPPRHWNCRSTLVPIVKSSEELGTDVQVDEGARASMDGEVADKTTFSDWLEGKSKAQQDDILGAGRADLWRDGKITLRELLDQSGRPLTLEQLEAQVAGESRYAGLAREYGGAVSGTGRPALVNINAMPTNDELFTQDRVLKAADNLGFPPDKIVFDYAEEKFTVGGTEYTLGGRALPDGRVQINVRGIMNGDVEGLTAHEIQHVRFGSVLDAYAKDSAALSNDTRTAVLESGRRVSIMFPDGSLREEFAKDYPIYSKLEPFINRAASELARDDGVTQYSRDWWKEAANGTASTHSAVNETLSEIARGRAQLLQEGIAPTKLWNDYFDAVTDVFNTHLKKKP